MITQEQLAEWKALTEAATNGPWVTQKYGYPEYDIVRQQDYVPCGEPGHDDCVICQTVHTTGADVAYLIFAHKTERAKRNAAFIAAARTAVPLLIAEVERLRTDVYRPEITLKYRDQEIADTEAWQEFVKALKRHGLVVNATETGSE